MVQTRPNGSETLRVVGRWVRRRLGGLRHERRVVRIARALFDLTREWHGLDGRGRRLLELAAIVHDVGRAVDDDEHPAEGARLILGDERLPLTAGERRALAYLTRYHRGAVPGLGQDGLLHDGDARSELRVLLALLRAADALDGRKVRPDALCFAVRGDQIAVTCYADASRAKVRKYFGRRKKFKLLTSLLGCRVKVTLRHTAQYEVAA